LSSPNDRMTKIRKMGCLLLWLLLSVMMAVGQTDAGTGQAPDDSQRNTPAPAFGQEAPAVVVNENPPISALDQPSLEPNIQPRSMLLGGVEGAESLDSNIGSDARPAWHSVSHALAGLTLQRLWSRYQVEGAYVGGVSYYNSAGNGWRQVHDLQAQTAVLWRTGQLTIRDSFSYLPEGEFGGTAFGGVGGLLGGVGGRRSAVVGGVLGLVGLLPREGGELLGRDARTKVDSELGPFEALTEDSAHERARMAHEVLGLALAGIPGRLPDALRHLEEADRLSPDPEREQVIAHLRAEQQ